jgi:hypothetical protein
MLEDHELHPKLGRLKSRERAQKLSSRRSSPRHSVQAMSAGAGPHNPQPGIPDRGAAAAEWPLCVPQSDGYTVIVRAG